MVYERMCRIYFIENLIQFSTVLDLSAVWRFGYAYVCWGSWIASGIRETLFVSPWQVQSAKQEKLILLTSGLHGIIFSNKLKKPIYIFYVFFPSVRYVTRVALWICSLLFYSISAYTHRTRTVIKMSIQLKGNF